MKKIIAFVFNLQNTLLTLLTIRGYLIPLTIQHSTYNKILTLLSRRVTYTIHNTISLLAIQYFHYLKHIQLLTVDTGYLRY